MCLTLVVAVYKSAPCACRKHDALLRMRALAMRNCDTCPGVKVAEARESALAADKDELEGCNHPAMPVTGKLAALKWVLFEGGTPFDAFLTAASAQVCR